MREFGSLAAFASFAAGLVAEVDHAKHHMLDEAAKIVEDEAKRVIGTYDYNWPSLAPTTQAERVRLGYSADEPLLRSGALRDSIEHKVVDNDNAQVGSNKDEAVWMELGTRNVPARSFLAGAAVAKEGEVHELLGKRIVTKLVKT